MPYINADKENPMENVDVWVVTESGKKGIARWWDVTKSWLTSDSNLSVNDRVKKWKFENAKHEQRKEKKE